MPTHSSGATFGGAASMRVVMLDLLSIIPYYTGHLCEALHKIGQCEVTLASITYDHDVEFFSRKAIHNDPGALDLTFKLRCAPVRLRQMLKGVEYLVNLLALLGRIVRFRPDVLHVQFLPLLAHGIPVERWFLQIVRALGIRTVYTVHNVLPHNTGNRYRETYRRIYQLPDKLICHDSQATARLQTDFAVSPHRVTIIPHGPFFEALHAPPREQVRARLGFANDECVVLWQGILQPYKGVSFLLKAWRSVCAANPRATLLIVGSGERRFEQEVRDEVLTLGVQCRVLLELRFVSVEELSEFYTAADVLVYPYCQITTSGALMTGIVQRKAIVATTLPAFQSLFVHEKSALLIRYGDESGLAENLLRLINDPALRHNLAEQLYKQQSQLPRWDIIATLTLDCYRALLAHKRCRASDRTMT